MANVIHGIKLAHEKWEKQVENGYCCRICLFDVEIEMTDSLERQVVYIALGTSKQSHQESVSVNKVYYFAENWDDILSLCENDNESGFKIINFFDLIPIKSQKLYVRQLQSFLNRKCRSFNELYFENKLPFLPVLARSAGVFVNNQEVLCSYEYGVSFDAFTRIITEIRDSGRIYVNTRQQRAEEEYLAPLAECMIYAYIYLVLRRYPKNIYGKILFHGNVYERFATLINTQEGLNINKYPIKNMNRTVLEEIAKASFPDSNRRVGL